MFDDMEDPLPARKAVEIALDRLIEELTEELNLSCHLADAYDTFDEAAKFVEKISASMAEQCGTIPEKVTDEDVQRVLNSFNDTSIERMAGHQVRLWQIRALKGQVLSGDVPAETEEAIKSVLIACVVRSTCKGIQSLEFQDGQGNKHAASTFVYAQALYMAFGAEMQMIYPFDVE